MTTMLKLSEVRDVESLPAVAAADFRDAMSRLATAVNVVTTDGPAGRAGFTASAVCSVTDSPPTLLVCLNHSASAYGAFAGNPTLCVNVLAADHESVSNAFGGGSSMPERFAQATWTARQTGSPILGDALAHFDCRITQRVTVGTHDVMFCEVVGLYVHHPDDGERHCLVYFGRRYHHLTRSESGA